MVLAIAWLLFTVRLGLNLQTTVDMTIQGFAKQMPSMTMKQQQLNTDKPGAYNIHYPGGKQIFAVVQTDKSLANFAQYPAEVWIGRYRTLYKSSQAIHAWNYNKMTDGKINAQNFAKIMAPYVANFTRILIVIFYIVGLVIIFPCSLVFAWLMSPYIKSVGSSLNVIVGLKKARNLAVVSMAPFWILLGLLYVFKILTALTIILSLIVLVLYPVYATIACQKMMTKRAKENK